MKRQVGIWTLYLVVSMTIFTPYYNWQYAKENGFVSWFLLGEIVPTMKAMAWPYFVFFQKSDKVEWTKEEKENLSWLQN